MRKRLNAKKRNSIRRTKWMLGMPSSGKDSRGIQAEEKVFNALGYFKKKKTIFSCWNIEDIQVTRHFSSEDKEGKDIVLELKSEESDIIVVPVQVKDWWSLAEEQKWAEKGICLIAIWPEEEGRTAQRRVFEALNKFLREDAKN